MSQKNNDLSSFENKNENIVQNGINQPSLNKDVISTPKKKKSFWHILGNVCLWVVIALLGLFAINNIWSGIDRATGYNAPFFGYRFTAITSGSMSYVNEKYKDELKDCTNQIQKGDMVISSYSSFEDLKVHDIILFKYENVGLVCHRIYDIFTNAETGQKCIITKGDANNVCDNIIAYDTCFVGKVTSIIPGVGSFFLFIQSPYGLLGICCAGAFVVIGILIIDWDKDKKNKKDKFKEVKELKEDHNQKIEESNETTKPISVKVRCVKCGHTFSSSKDIVYVCPKCGAKMSPKPKDLTNTK